MIMKYYRNGLGFYKMISFMGKMSPFCWLQCIIFIIFRTIDGTFSTVMILTPVFLATHKHREICVHSCMAVSMAIENKYLIFIKVSHNFLFWYMYEIDSSIENSAFAQEKVWLRQISDLFFKAMLISSMWHQGSYPFYLTVTIRIQKRCNGTMHASFL